MKSKYEYWFGDESSLSTYQRALEATMDVDLLTRSRPSEPSNNHLLSQHGDIAVVSIQGSLLPFSNWMTQAMGLTGYPDIRDALVTAAEDDSVQQIVLDINSPGGSASGIEDISQLMAKIDKPITAYTNGTMASAAYWIAAAADKVYASSLASVGSIGVIATHFDLTKSLENDGVKATIFRSGEFKALGGPYEKLTDKASTVIQTRLDTLYEAFVSHVAQSRNVSTKTVHDKMADGREFLGHEALQAGLIDGIMSIDDLMVNLSSKKSPTGRANTRMEASEMKKKLLNQQAVAVLEAGGDLQTALEVAPEAVEGEEEAVVEAPEQQEVAPEEPAEEAPAQAEDASLVSYLKTELAAANEKLLQASMDSRAAQAKLDNLMSTHEQMRSIVIDATNIKRVALGGSSMDLSGLSDEVLLQQFQQASAEFGKTFPIGGKAQLPSTEAPAPVTTHAHQARIGAVRASKI